MIIDSAQIALSSQRQYTRRESESTTLLVNGRTRGGGEASNTEGQGPRSQAPGPDVLDLRISASRTQASLVRQSLIEAGTVTKDEEEGIMDPNAELTKMLLEKLLGKKVEVSVVADFQPSEGAAPGGGGGPQVDSVRFEYNREFYESESVDFQASGKVRTKDGQEIDFQLDLSMEREYAESESLLITAGRQEELVDPLVLNFDGGAADLTDAKYTFDLDADGQDDQISFLRSGSAFLAFDRNKDGVINDGSELFGPTTGDGFAELSVYDADGNRFIDEADAIYDQLQLYNKDASGQDQLSDLKSSGVGAIYLGSADTQFSVNNADNETQGVIRQTGVFLKEDTEGTYAGTGTVQHVDLAV